MRQDAKIKNLNRIEGCAKAFELDEQLAASRWQAYR
jgi:hypothetical protein